ncbi:unnamed protein product [Eruca vesicaria subsp. sativa]|uniref:Carboxypeptidase n=1 Tax=Eruca vesicaria subsp. sativa TaxID=29727 RepID=A0ABC8LY65_ERUVS|nr:unnamed protein product [Eruca vesicaria subsp. sativa]
MGKGQLVWSVTAFAFLFLSLASQVHCRSHVNGIRRLSAVNQTELKEKDLIESFPGQPPVSFKQYGGYVPVNEAAGRFFYYYFVEANKSSDTAPLVLWLNGGPGCSSLGGGGLQEQGPFRVHSDGKSLFLNPYAFNNEANMLYLESPAGVGFSYANTPENIFDSNDKKTAEDNYMFLLNWLERFPEYKTKEFYIAGQSYAGHYGPQLAQIILQRNKQTFINLRGLLLGNPSLDRKVETDSENPYMVSHAIIPQKFIDDTLTCGEGPQCSDALWNLDVQKDHVDLYNILAPKCSNETLTSEPNKDATVMVYEPCSESYVRAYLNNETVQKALHVNPTTLTDGWQFCNHTISDQWNEKDRYRTLVPVLHEIMGQGIRIVVYSGDLDLAVPVTGTIQVIKNMNLTVEKVWHRWFSGGDLGGFTEQYKGNFTFATVRGAGHHAAIDQPLRALTIFSSFIRNTPLPIGNFKDVSIIKLN